jgi:hypothetical protein
MEAKGRRSKVRRWHNAGQFATRETFHGDITGRAPPSARHIMTAESEGAQK